MATGKHTSIGSGSVIGKSVVLGILAGTIVSQLSTKSTNYRSFLAVKSAAIGCALFLGGKVFSKPSRAAFNRLFKD